LNEYTIAVPFALFEVTDGSLRQFSFKD